MGKPWFKPIGLFMIPNAIFGWIILLLTIIYMIWAFIDIDGRSLSVSDTLINWVFRGLIVAVIYTVITRLSLLLVKKP
ncbi:MAG: hypothetical protein ABUT20_43900 [Bacteroidota bacterium]